MTGSIVFDDVWKKFRRGERHDSLRDLVPSILGRVVGRGRRPDKAELGARDFWAVSGISFEVRPGEALGIIGPNGAGKSTILKLLTRILRPTRGHCAVRGRVGALIEVAAGFHPDLTGRENVFLQGAIVGMKRAEIARKFDQIVEFAGVGEFIDTQVKRYSSGMNARLGFSIAAHLDPDALIIDEVLSVGDIHFQERCIERMREFKRLGTAIVFVSHNLQAVATLCDRALYLKGSVQAFGRPDEVLTTYVESTRPPSQSADRGAIRIESAELVGRNGKAATVAPGARLTLRVSFAVTEPVADFHFGFFIHRSTDALLVYDGNVQGHELGLVSVEPGDSFTVDFDFVPNFTRGQYDVGCHVFHNPTSRYLDSLRPAAIVTVQEYRTVTGIADVELSCRLRAPGGVDTAVAAPRPSRERGAFDGDTGARAGSGR
jgi:lipopolysaccharide transport system ATP-binding protein